jgi:putative flavoprotein involved in K+ transport
MRFPASGWAFPTKDEMADYMVAYVDRFELPVRTGVAVERLRRDGDGFVLTTNRGPIRADRVVVATGASRVPRTPTFASDLDPGVLQMHSHEYRNPSQLRDGPVLVVGVGNSGAEIALELSAGRRTVLAGTPSGEIPVEHGPGLPSRIGFRLFRFFGHHVVTRRNPLGRRLLPKLLAHGDPLVRTKTKHLEAAGVERVGRITGIRDGLPVTDDGTTAETANVIWATGFRQDFPWIDLPVLDADGRPRHVRGLVDAAPGLAFVGLVGQFSLSSDVLPGRQRDAAYVAKRLAAGVRVRSGRERSTALPAPA